MKRLQSISQTNSMTSKRRWLQLVRLGDTHTHTHRHTQTHIPHFQRFEKLEEEHTGFMLTFAHKLLEVSDNTYMKSYKECEKAKEKLDQLPGRKLLQVYAQTKGTGRKRPGSSVSCLFVCLFVCRFFSACLSV